MPAHLVPIAIVIAKLGASAVVSLAPVAMTRTEDGQGQVVTERRRFRDFLSKEFYEKEFARLENEQLVHDKQPVPLTKNVLLMEREFASLQNERSVAVATARRSHRQSRPSSE